MNGFLLFPVFFFFQLDLFLLLKVFNNCSFLSKVWHLLTCKILQWILMHIFLSTYISLVVILYACNGDFERWPFFFHKLFSALSFIKLGQGLHPFHLLSLLTSDVYLESAFDCAQAQSHPIISFYHLGFNTSDMDLDFPGDVQDTARFQINRK